MEYDGQQRMEEVLGIKLKLHQERNQDLLYDYLKEEKGEDKASPRVKINFKERRDKEKDENDRLANERLSQL